MIANTPTALRKLFSRYPDRAALRTCYEAGPTGYDTHRLLSSLGVSVVLRHNSPRSSLSSLAIYSMPPLVCPTHTRITCEGRHLTAVTRAYLTGRHFLLEALVGCLRLLADQDIYPVQDQFELGV